MKARTVQAKKSEAEKPKTTIRTIIIAVLVVAVIGVIAGIAIYRDRVAPFRLTILVVGDTSIDMKYFLKRARLGGGDPFAMLEILTREEIIKQVAPKPPYNIDIQEEDIDQFLRDIARGESDEMDEGDFKEWYRQQLNESRLSDGEFRAIATVGLLTLRLREYLAEKVPTVAEQVHLHMIPVNDFDVAGSVKERLEAGEDFGRLAREMSSEEVLKENGGDFGWVPRVALAPVIARTAFDELEIGAPSDPLYLNDETFAIIMVSEKVPAREIDGDSLQMIKANALDEWLKGEQQHINVEFHGFNNGYDTETDAWVRWQLQRMNQ